jgi:predicted DNA-binding antitoxin AbrB/MazE fold protein
MPSKVLGMTKVIRAVYEEGVFKPEEPVHLADKSRVQIVIEPVPAAPEGDPTGWKAMREFIGLAGNPTTPGETNAAEDHDPLLYGR